MLIDTNDLVSATDFNRNTGRYTALAAEGRRIVIIKDQQLVAALVGIHDLNRLDTLDGAPGPDFDAPGAEEGSRAEPPPGVLVIGHTVTGEAAYVDPRESLMVVGRGASDFMSALLARIGETPDDLNLQFVIASERAILLPRPSAPDRAPTILSVSGTHDTTFSRLADQVAGEIDRRAGLLAESSVSTIDQLRRLTSDSPANLVIVIGDADGADPDILKQVMSEVSRAGEKLGISMWLFAATASQRSLLRDAEISQRVALPMESPAHSRDLVYSDIAYRLKHGQAALLKRGGDLIPFRIPATEADRALTPALPAAPPVLQWPPLPAPPPLDSIVDDSDDADDGSAAKLPIGVIDQPRRHSQPVYSLTLTPGEFTDVQTDEPKFARAFIRIVLRSASLAVHPSAQAVRFLYIGAKNDLPGDTSSQLLDTYTWEHFADPLNEWPVRASVINDIPDEAQAADGTTVLIANTVNSFDGLIITDLLGKAMVEDNFHVVLLRRSGAASERVLRELTVDKPANTVYGRGIDATFLSREIRHKLRGLPVRRKDVYDGITPDGSYLVLGQ